MLFKWEVTVEGFFYVLVSVSEITDIYLKAVSLGTAFIFLSMIRPC